MAAAITRLTRPTLPVRFGCEVPRLRPHCVLGAKEARRVGSGDAARRRGGRRCARRCGRFRLMRHRSGGHHGHRGRRHHHARGAERGLHRQGRAGHGSSPFFVPMMMANAGLPGTIADAFRLDRTEPLRRHCVRSDRPTRSARPPGLVRDGCATTVMTGGSESCMVPTAIAAFTRVTTLEHAQRRSRARVAAVGRRGARSLRDG